jgi:MurNAc alpha-1-phosphate uridylyltransferase
MQAIILAAGIGKRLRPYTDRTPKCLVPVNGIPIIVNSLDRLAEQKVSRVVIVIGKIQHRLQEPSKPCDRKKPQ